MLSSVVTNSASLSQDLVTIIAQINADLTVSCKALSASATMRAQGDVQSSNSVRTRRRSRNAAR